MGAPGFRQAVTLASEGIPFEVAARWSDARRMAAMIALGEYRGRKFNWLHEKWEG